MAAGAPRGARAARAAGAQRRRGRGTVPPGLPPGRVQDRRTRYPSSVVSPPPVSYEPTAKTGFFFPAGRATSLQAFFLSAAALYLSIYPRLLASKSLCDSPAPAWY